MRRVLAAMLLSGWWGAGMAASVEGVNTLSQSEFELITQDLAAAFSYKAGASSAPLGTTGFDLGVSMVVTEIIPEHEAAWKKAMSGESLKVLAVPKLYLQKGLPFDVDLGAYYLSLPGSNLQAWGGEIKYAILDGGISIPAVAIRLAATSLFGVEQFTLNTRSVDVGISKRFLFLTPYAGIGRVWSVNTPMGNAEGVLDKVDLVEDRTFVGLSFTPGGLQVALERDTVGEVISYNLKLGLGF